MALTFAPAEIAKLTPCGGGRAVSIARCPHRRGQRRTRSAALLRLRPRRWLPCRCAKTSASALFPRHGVSSGSPSNRGKNRAAFSELGLPAHDSADDLDGDALHLDAVPREDDDADVHPDRFAPAEPALGEQEDEGSLRTQPEKPAHGQWRRNCDRLRRSAPVGARSRSSSTP